VKINNGGCPVFSWIYRLGWKVRLAVAAIGYNRRRRRFPPLPQEDDPQLGVPLKVREMFDRAEKKGTAHGFWQPPPGGGLL